MKRILFLLFSFCCFGIKAQENIKPVFCGNEVFTKMLRDKYPDLNEAFNSTFEEVRTSLPSRGNDPLEINVVVHVVWNGTDENLEDSIVNNQILVLNNDYNRHNADSANLRSIFQPEAGSTNIHFNLAGIVRVHTNQLFDFDILSTNLLSEVKHDVDGGSEAWNPDEYLNIWVCKIQPITIFGVTIGQILGFAFPPNNLQNWPANSGAPTQGEDGVVIDYRVFGSNNPNTIENPDGSGDIVVNGRTPVHEVGHYLGLRHIWGDGGVFEPNNCDQSDGVDDTPFAKEQSAFDCDTSKNTCSQIESHYNKDVPDLIENYMDYASEACMNMFTHGQAQLMRNTLLGPRSGLLGPISSTQAINQAPYFKFFPNPSAGDLTIDLLLKEKTNVAIRILNVNGKEMMRKANETYSSGEQRIQLNLKDILPGIYFLELRTQGGVRYEKVMLGE